MGECPAPSANQVFSRHLPLRHSNSLATLANVGMNLIFRWAAFLGRFPHPICVTAGDMLGALIIAGTFYKPTVQAINRDSSMA